MKITDKLHIIGLVAVISAGIYSVFPGMNACMSIDEARSADIAAMNLTGIINEVAKDNHPPLYYLLLALWMKMFGNSESVLRALSVLFYIAGVFSIYYLSNYIYKNKITGLFVAALFALSSIALRHSISVRMYSLLPAVIALSYFLFIKIFINSENTLKNISAIIAINIAGSFIHYWYLFVILGQIVFAMIFCSKRIKEIIAVLFLSLLPLFLTWGHVFAVQATNGSMNFIRMKGDEIQRTLFDFFAPNANIFMQLLIISLIAGLLKRLIESKSIMIVKNEYLSGMASFFNNKINLFLFTSSVVMLLAPFIFSILFVPVYLPGRYTITTFIPFIIIFGGFFHKFSEKKLIWLSLFAYFIVFTAPVFLFDTQVSPYSERIKTKRVLQDINDGDVVFYLPLNWVTADYYFMRLKNTKNIVKTGFPSENYINHPCWSNDVKLSSNELMELKVKCAELKKLLKTRQNKIIVYWGNAPEINAQVLKEFEINFKVKYSMKQSNRPELTYFEYK